MIYLYLTFREYMRDFVYHVWGSDRDDNAIAFPRKSAEHDLLYRLLQPMPVGADPVPKSWNVKLVIPDYRNKPPEKYCHLTVSGERALEDSCATLEAVMLTSHVRSLIENQMADRNISAERAIDMINWKIQTRAWMECHGIGIDSEDTIYKQVMRLLKYYREIHLIESPMEIPVK